MSRHLCKKLSTVETVLKKLDIQRSQLNTYKRSLEVLKDRENQLRVTINTIPKVNLKAYFTENDMKMLAIQMSKHLEKKEPVLSPLNIQYMGVQKKKEEHTPPKEPIKMHPFGIIGVILIFGCLYNEILTYQVYPYD